MDPRDEAPDDPDHDRERDRGELPDSLRQRLEAMVPELVKRTFAAGGGGVKLTSAGAE